MSDAIKSRISQWIQQQVKEYQILPRKFLSLNNLLFVSGHSGTGKTYMINQLCQELDLHIIYITSSNCTCSNELNDLLIKSCSSSLIQTLSNDNRAKMIVIDEFESLMALDRTVNVTLLNILNAKKLKMVPIICISSIDIIKKIGIIKKKCQIIELPLPTAHEIYNILLKEFPNKCQRYLKQIADAADGNIGQSIEKATGDNSYAFIDEIYDINVLYSNKYEREKIRKMISADQWIVPLRFHENLIGELGRRKTTIASAKRLYTVFILNMLIFDILLHNECTEIAADIFASAIHPLSQITLKKNAVSNIDNFTKLLSYLSLQKKYSKKIYTDTDFPLYQIGNYHTNIMNTRNYIFLK
jgi:nucleoside-triphosphatase THEP1